MISRKTSLILLAVGGLAGFIEGGQSSLRTDEALAAALVTTAAFFSVLLGRGVERIARGMGSFLTRVADRKAELRPAWSPGKWIVAGGVLGVGVGLGMLTRYFKGDAASAWPALATAGAGCGFLSGELIARKVFGIGKESSK